MSEGLRHESSSRSGSPLCSPSLSGDHPLDRAMANDDQWNELSENHKALLREAFDRHPDDRDAGMNYLFEKYGTTKPIVLDGRESLVRIVDWDATGSDSMGFDGKA